MHQDSAARIEEEIRSRFSAGIDLEPETIHFIESTFGAMSPAALAELLTSETGEKEVLVDLLFSPEEALCCRIEHHLAPEGLLPGQRNRLADRLRQNRLATRIRTGAGAIRVFLPADLVEGFLGRLCPDLPLDAALVTAVSDLCPEAVALQVRFRLRQAGLSGIGAEKKVLLDLMAARRPGEADFWPLFETLVGFLKAATAKGDLFSALADRKQTCLRHLRQTVDRSRTLERHNIETILVGGDRLPYVDTEALADEIVRIDDLGRILFGGPFAAAAAELPLDLGEVSSREDLDRLMRFFTEG